MMANIRGVVIFLAALLAAPLPAQQGELERIRTEKKAWVALNMALTPAEADSFWPIYEGYQQELHQINTRLVKVIEAYGADYRNSTFTDESARKLMEEMVAIGESEAKLRRSYWTKLSKALSARKAARYLQLEERIHIQTRYELGTNLPLVGDPIIKVPSGK